MGEKPGFPLQGSDNALLWRSPQNTVWKNSGCYTPPCLFVLHPDRAKGVVGLYGAAYEMRRAFVRDLVTFFTVGTAHPRKARVTLRLDAIRVQSDHLLLTLYQRYGTCRGCGNRMARDRHLAF